MASLASQLITETKASIYARGLALASALGLTVTSWAPGDPTRSLYHFVSEILEALEINVAGYVSSGFLDYATGDWLTLLADQVFGVTRVEATYASTSVTLTNAGGGVYVIAAGDIVVRSSLTGKTYTNTNGGTLTAVGTPTVSTTVGPAITLDFTANEAGADSSAGATEIDELVNGPLGVTCSNAAAAVGLDEEDDASLRTRCRAKLGTLSATGPRDAYDFVVQSSDLTGVTDITKSRTIADSTTGNVTVYVAGASGAVAGASVTAAQAAVEEWAAPLCITPTVTNVSNVTVPVTYQVWIYTSVGETTATIEAAIATKLTALFAARPIGGDIISPATTGKLYQSLISAAIRSAYPDHTFRVSVSAPAGDTSLAINQCAVLGTVTPTVTLEVDP